MLDSSDLHPGGRIINTYQAKPKALGSGEPVTAGARRFIVDFAGGDLDYHLRQPERVGIVPSIAYGRIDRAFLVPNPKTQGLPRLHRHRGRARPDRGDAGLPQERRQDADGDLELPLALGSLRPDRLQDAAAITSISTLNAGRVKPETIIRVEAGGGAPTWASRDSI